MPPSNQQSRATLEYLDVRKLDFDPTNPRFGATLGSKTQDEIQQILSEAPYYALELIDSLLKNGYIDYEPLVVRRADSRYTVIEGNRRLAAIKEILAHPEKYTGKTDDLTKVPSLIFPDKPDQQQSGEMRIYLGVRHLIGFRDWPPISKAAFLDRLSNEAGGLARVLQELRITKHNAKRLLLPFRLLASANIPIPKDEDFWTLGEAMTRSGVKDFLKLEHDSSFQITDYNKIRLGHLLDFLYGKKTSKGERDSRTSKVSETRELSRFARTIGSETAYKAMLNGESLSEAEIYVDTSQESRERLEKVVRELNRVIKKVVGKSTTHEAKRLSEAKSEIENAMKEFFKKSHS